MRATVSIICLLAIFLSSSKVFGWTAVGFYKNPAYPGKCVIDADTILDEGQAILQAGCVKAHCGSLGVVDFFGCGKKIVGPSCTIGEIKYPDAEYPKCCLNVVRCTGREDFEI
ncbi:hypothetical protein ACLKA6_015132 [Drosophila palustris]